MRLLDHLRSEKIPFYSQHGFRPGIAANIQNTLLDTLLEAYLYAKGTRKKENPFVT